MKGILVFGGILLMALLAACAVGWMVNTMDSYSCAAKWENSPYPHTQYGFIEGCRVSKEGKVYLPASSVREF